MRGERLIIVPILGFVLLFTVVGSHSFRQEKALSVFNVVRFKNDPCVGGTKNGTCYLAAECETRGGVNVGACAAGYGVCCAFTQGCGKTTSENCTYFESGATTAAGTCNLEVCKSQSDICQLRLDMDTFVIAGPSTGTLSTMVTFAGTGSPVSQASNCLTDTFAVTSPGGVSPPVICGTNSNEHMYVEASDSCNLLTFNLGSGTGAPSSRMWSIKVSQIACDSELLPPKGCTQYYYGSTTGSVATFNYNGGQGNYHLANQNQNICIRRERGSCRVCFSTAQKADFQVSGTFSTGQTSTQISSSLCCKVSATTSSNGFDCLSIPGAMNSMGAAAANMICGRSSGPAAMTATTFTRCTSLEPFAIRFLSDGVEVTGAMAGEANSKKQRGFKLNFMQDSSNC